MTETTTADPGPLQPLHLPSLLRAAESGLGDVLGLMEIGSRQALRDFARRWLLPREHERLKLMLRGLEAFVRRMLLLMAIALAPVALAQAAPLRARRAKAAAAGPLVHTFALRIFPAGPRARKLRARMRYEAEEKPFGEP